MQTRSSDRMQRVLLRVGASLLGRWLQPRVRQHSAFSAISWRFDLRGAVNTQQLRRQNFCSRWTSFVNSLPVQLRNPDITYGLFRQQLKGHLFSGRCPFTFIAKHEHGALWLLICGALEKRLLTYLLTYLKVLYVRECFSNIVVSQRNKNTAWWALEKYVCLLLLRGVQKLLRISIVKHAAILLVVVQESYTKYTIKKGSKHFFVTFNFMSISVWLSNRYEREKVLKADNKIDEASEQLQNADGTRLSEPRRHLEEMFGLRRVNWSSYDPDPWSLAFK